MAKTVTKNSSKTSKLSEIHIEFKYLMIVVLAAMLSYVAYYLKYPSTWAAILNIGLLVLLILDFHDINGVKVIIYAMILSVLSLPITVFLLNMPLLYQLIIFVINMVLMVFIAIGLKHLKRWGFYVAIVVFALSIVSLVAMILPVLGQFTWDQFFITLTLKQLFSGIFYALSIAYLIKHRNYFK